MEEDGDNADENEDYEKVDLVIRDEIKRRAEILLNVHRRVEDGKKCTIFEVFTHQ